MRHLAAWALALAAFLSLAAPARADLLLDVISGTGASPGGDTIAGWGFTLTTSVTVDGLGLWDQGGDGLAHSHAAGLWNSDGSALLATATVDNSATPVGSASPDGRWLFVDIPALVLGPGSYVLGAAFLDQDPDLAQLLAATTTAPGVVLGDARQKLQSPTLAFPDLISPGLNAGIFGANLRIASVPEPASLAMVGLGLPIALVAWRRRRAS